MGLEVRIEERVADGNLRVIPEVVVVAVDTNEPSLEELCCFMARGGGCPCRGHWGDRGGENQGSRVAEGIMKREGVVSSVESCRRPCGPNPKAVCWGSGEGLWAMGSGRAVPTVAGWEVTSPQ